MAREGPLVIRNFSPTIACLVILAVGAMDARAQKTESKPGPIDRKPYAIRILLEFDPETRVDNARRDLLLDEWFDLVRRFVGAPWAPEVIHDLGSLPATAIEDLKPEDLKAASDRADKVWAIRVRNQGAGLIMEGRELDVITGMLGEVHRRTVGHPVDSARELLRLTLAIFTPSADVGESKAGGVSFLIQGGSLPPASPLGEVAPVGSVFRALRIFPRENSSTPEVIEIPYSYFRVERREGPIARCEIIRGMGDPLTNRYARKNKLVALGIKPGKSPTILRFLLKGDRLPAVGYRLVARSIPPGLKPIEVGMTDREGQITLPAGFAEGLVSLRLLAGNDEPMLDIPFMPGETPEGRKPIVFEPRPLTLALEAKLDALRDTIIDILALRSRLELRMKARFDGEDWVGLDEAIKEFRKLTPRETFESRLTKIREEGEAQEAQTKTLVLTKTARALLDETKGLIDRYLDDDSIRSYEDAARQAKAEREKAATKKGAKKSG